MVSRAPPAVAPPPVLRPDRETLARFTSTWSKPLDLDVCPALSHPPVGFEAQPISHRPLGFEAQNKKPSWWFWDSNHQTIATGFEAQTGKPEPPILRSNQKKPSPPVLRPKQRKPSVLVLRPNRRKLSQWFWGQTTDKLSQWFWGQTTHKPSTLVLELNQETYVPRLHVWPSLILCTRSSTPIIIFIATYHAAPATCTPWDKQTWFSKWNKDKVKLPKCFGFEFKHR
jgi:hypothetical protein